jgi:hypothetical protein
MIVSALDHFFLAQQPASLYILHRYKIMVASVSF